MGGFDGGGTLTDGPGTDLIFAGGEEGNITKRLIERAGQDVNRRLRNAERGEEFTAFGGTFDLGNFGLGLGAERADFATWARQFGLRLFDELRIREIGFAAVERGDDAFDGEELQ